MTGVKRIKNIPIYSRRTLKLYNKMVQLLAGHGGINTYVTCFNLRAVKNEHAKWMFKTCPLVECLKYEMQCKQLLLNLDVNISGDKDRVCLRLASVQCHFDHSCNKLIENNIKN